MQANPYGLESLWLQGDIVIRSVAVLLLVLSVASWYVIVTKTLQILRYRRASMIAGRQFWDSSNVQEGVAALGDNNPFADLAKAGVEAMHHHSAHQGHLHDQLSVSDWVTLSLRQELTDIQYGRLPDRHGWLMRLDETSAEAATGSEANA